jgi:putative inorganic carbon (HCO3(-)) transporter
MVLTARDKPTLSAATGLFLLVGLGFIVFGILGTDWRVKAPVLKPILNLIPSRLIEIPEAPIAGVTPNQFAGVLLFYLPIVLSLAIGWRPMRQSKIVLFLLISSAAIIGGWLVLTQSRAGWIGGLLGITAVLLLWWLLTRPSKRRKVILLTLALLVFFTAISLVAIGSERMGYIWDEPLQTSIIGSLGTINFRFEVWRWALAAIQDFPFTGTGLGTYRHVVLRLYPIDIDPGYDIAHAHNIFLQVGLDAGIPGLISYISMLIIAFSTGWRAAKADAVVRSLAIGLLAALIALHVYGMADTLALGSKPGLIFWMALGLLGAMYRISLSEGIEQETSDPVEELSLSGAHSD